MFAVEIVLMILLLRAVDSFLSVHKRKLSSIQWWYSVRWPSKMLLKLEFHISVLVRITNNDHHGKDTLSVSMVFVREIRWSSVNSPREGPVLRSFDVLFVVILNNLLNKQWRCRWFDMPLCSCDDTVLVNLNKRLGSAGTLDYNGTLLSRPPSKVVSW